MSFYQRLHIGEQCFLLILHVTAYFVGILIVEAKNEASQRVVFVERLSKFPADKGQLEIEEVSVAGLQIVEQRGDTELFVSLEFAVTVDGIVHHGEECVGIHMVVFTSLLHGLVAKAKVDTETAQGLEQVVIVTDKRNHLIIGLV